MNIPMLDKKTQEGQRSTIIIHSPVKSVLRYGGSGLLIAGLVIGLWWGVKYFGLSSEQNIDTSIDQVNNEEAVSQWSTNTTAMAGYKFDTPEGWQVVNNSEYEVLVQEPSNKVQVKITRIKATVADSKLIEQIYGQEVEKRKQGKTVQEVPIIEDKLLTLITSEGSPRVIVVKAGLGVFVIEPNNVNIMGTQVGHQIAITLTPNK